MPIADSGATAHIIATRDDDEALTTDIDVVLYEKTATGWQGEAYDPHVTKEDAMIDLADEFGLPDPFGGEWHIDLDEEDVLEYMLPRAAFGKGFFVTDPLYVIAEHMVDPEPLAEAAESSGLAAGSGAINTGSISGGSGGTQVDPPNPDGCGCDACAEGILDGIVAGSDAGLADPSLSLEDMELIGHEATEAIIGCCWPRNWTQRGSSTSTCTPTGAWVLTGTTTRPVAGGFRLTCEYSRPVSVFNTRKQVSRCFDCTRTTFNQARTLTGTQTTSNSVDYLPTDPVPACPGPGSGAACGIVGGVTTDTDWTPPIPACP